MKISVGSARPVAAGLLEKKETARSGCFGFRQTIAVDHNMCGVQSFKQTGHTGMIGRLAFQDTEEPFERAPRRSAPE